MIDFLGIGAQKAGTTWLSWQLRQHPSVWMPIIKEIHFFDHIHLDFPIERFFRKLQRRSRARIASCLEMVQDGQPGDASVLAEISYHERVADPDFAYSEGWYRYVFSAAPEESCKGEITPLYGSIGEEGIEHVKTLAPDVKLIYIIRDPVDRALSSLRMKAGKKRTLEQILTERLFVARCDYRSDITYWDAHFGEQVMYVPFGDVRERPGRVMRSVESHLGLRPYDRYEDLGRRRNPTNQSVEIPEEIVQSIKDLVAPQYGFLKERFGPKFIERIA